MKINIDQIRNISKYAPHRVYAILLISIGVIGLGLASFAYGPGRATYTIEDPADHITFNSITNNPNYGDERNFVLIKDAANTAAGGWSHTDINVTPGKEYLVRMYVHNNAAEDLNKVSTNTRVMANVPTTTGNQAQIDGFVTSDNASPKQVWDDVVLKSDKRFNIAYVAGSSRYYNNVNPSTGFALPDSIVTNAGALVGYQTMDGNVPGCFKYSGIATFRVKVQGETSADFTVAKQVRKHIEGQTGNWQKNITAEPGDKIDYIVEYKNTGQTQQDNVAVKDSLPENVSYAAGSSTLTNSVTPNGIKVSDNVVTPSGINIGSYSGGANAFVYFESTIGAEKNLAQCGNNVLRNTASVTTDYGTKQDTADVTVKKDCDDKPSYSCDALKLSKISQLQYSFDVNVSANKATPKEVTIDFGDGQTAIRSIESLPVKHAYAKAGEYTVTAKVSFEVDGKTVKDITSDACKVIVNTETTPTSTSGSVTTPGSIASTGPVEVIGGIAGVSALGIGIQQWFASRRAVAEALHHHE
ncbi:MAG: PKD domain-containing protein [Patescibacteria group bacterium]